MRRNATNIALVVLASCVLHNSYAATESKSTALASNDAQSIVNTLPNIEKLWPQQPEAYFQSVKQAASILDRLAKDPADKKALSSLFANMVQKSISTNGDMSVSFMELKCDAILYCLNFDRIKNDKSTWIAIAKYIGEVRAQIIPNYINKGKIYINPPSAMDSSLGENQQALQENEQNLAIDRLQQELRVTDRKLTFFLLHNIGRFSSNVPENKDFIQTIKSCAHLNEEEQHRLR